MKQRIFVAIGISEDLKASIAKWQKQNAKLAIRFIQPKNLHLTLIPPWYEDPKKIIKQMQKFSSSVKPFSLKFHLIESRPRLVWMKGKFSRELVECLASCGTGPMMMVNETYFENLTTQKVDQLLEKLAKQ